MDLQESFVSNQIDDIFVCEVCGNSIHKNDYQKHLKNHYKSQRGN